MAAGLLSLWKSESVKAVLENFFVIRARCRNDDFFRSNYKGALSCAGSFEHVFYYFFEIIYNRTALGSSA